MLPDDNAELLSATIKALQYTFDVANDPSVRRAPRATTSQAAVKAVNEKKGVKRPRDSEEEENSVSYRFSSSKSKQSNFPFTCPRAPTFYLIQREMDRISRVTT
jgi:hypothetical protein